MSGEENKVCRANSEVSNWQLLLSQAAALDELPVAFWVPGTLPGTHLPEGKENSTSRKPEILKAAL